MLLILLVTFAALLCWLALLAPQGAPRLKTRHRKHLADAPAKVHAFQRPKPEWVRKESQRLKALMPDGARKIDDTFNLLHARRGETVGKTFVAELVKKHHEEIVRLRREL